MCGLVLAWLLAPAGGLGLVAEATAQTRVRVEFTSEGDCRVSSTGPGFRGNVTYPRRTDARRCAIPAGARGEPVVLEVVLPAGTPRPAGEFPRMSWREVDGGWIGTAHLLAPPAFVRIPEGDDPSARLARVLDVAALVAAAIAILWSLAHGRA